MSKDLVKRSSGVLSPDGTKSGVAVGVAVAPMATLALAMILPGGIFFWALVMLVVGLVVY